MRDKDTASAMHELEAGFTEIRKREYPLTKAGKRIFTDEDRAAIVKEIQILRGQGYSTHAASKEAGIDLTLFKKWSGETEDLRTRRKKQRRSLLTKLPDELPETFSIKLPPSQPAKNMSTPMVILMGDSEQIQTALQTLSHIFNGRK